MAKLNSNAFILCLLCLHLTTFRVHSDEVTVTVEERLNTDLSYLASDELEGRSVGGQGLNTAATYIGNRMSELGLVTDAFNGTPYQKFQIPGQIELGSNADNWVEFTTSVGVTRLELNTDFNPLALGSSGVFEGQLVFVGYGIAAPELNYDEFADLDVKGKVVIAIRKEPQQSSDDSVFDGRRNSKYALFSTKEETAFAKGAAGLIIVNDYESVKRAEGKDQILQFDGAGKGDPASQVPTVFVSRLQIDKLLNLAVGKSLQDIELEIDEKLAVHSTELTGCRVKGSVSLLEKPIDTQNVVALLPGKGVLADEYLVVGAHYDHVGMGGRGSLAPGTVAIHNGADDNASGTVVLMEIARRISADLTPDRRSIVFIAFSAEEVGLLGSKYYVRSPRWPLESTVAMVNMDMVGRLNDNKLTVFGTGTAVGFEDLVQRHNAAAGFALEIQQAGFGPSDHDSFYKEKIPVFHLFTGLHNDYHRPSDDVELANIPGMARIADFATGIVMELATSPGRPEYLENTSRADVGRSRRGRTGSPRPDSQRP
ncbi:MAG: M28 family peptidase [Planctomycetales bacterium]|nr:M28 family peptidase [Planctomycetales bacterium]